MVGRRTPLFERQRALGAHFVPFAGWELPVQYGAGILAEHRAVRLAAGLFDVSHMGELSLRGPAAAAAMDWLCVNDPRGLVAGAALSASYWVFGQAFGQVLTGMATDVNAGPLFVLLAVALYPPGRRREAPGDRTSLPAAVQTSGCCSDLE